MGKLISVRLNESESKVSFVGGFDTVIEGYEKPHSRIRKGISVFLDGEYILNFVLNESEVELLKSDMTMKCIDDLGFLLLAKRYNLRVMKYRNSSYRESSFIKKFEFENNRTGSSCIREYNEVTITSDKEFAWIEALKLAMENMVEGSNLYTAIPSGLEEVVL